MKNTKGFTFIELLIVISILAILTTIGIVAFGNVIKNNRDQQRMNDLKTIKQSLELFRSDNHYYPTSSVFTLSCSTNSSLVSGSKTYLDLAPKDPLCSDRSYAYKALPDDGTTACSGTSCSGFVLCAKKEGSNVSSTCSHNGFTFPTPACQGTDLCDIGLSSD